MNVVVKEDKSLVNEFHKAGGLSQLVALGKEDEAQLQNFILRWTSSKH